VHKGSYAMEKGMLGCQTFTIRNWKHMWKLGLPVRWI
jgi:hypothetical protein